MITSEGEKKIHLPITAFVSHKYFLKYFLLDGSRACLACMLCVSYKKDVGKHESVIGKLEGTLNL